MLCAMCRRAASDAQLIHQPLPLATRGRGLTEVVSVSTVTQAWLVGTLASPFGLYQMGHV